MSAIRGLETKVNIGKQVSFTNPTTLARQALSVYNLTGGTTESTEEDNLLGQTLNNTYDPTETAPSLDDHAIAFDVPLCLNSFPFWCAAFFGLAVTDDAADPDFVHTFSSGTTPSPIFLEHFMKTGKYRRHYGLIGQSLSIDLSAEAGGYGKASFKFVGMSEDPQSTALAGVVTAAPTLLRPAQKLVKIIYDAVAGGDLVSGKFSIERKLKRIRSADGTGIPTSVEIDGVNTITGSLSTRFTDDSFYDDARNRIEVPLSFELFQAGSTVRGLGFDLGMATLDRMPVDVPGSEALQYNPNFRARQTADDPALTVRVLNARDTAALPSGSEPDPGAPDGFDFVTFTGQPVTAGGQPIIAEL